jgi:peptidoglycan hydrolase-like amidase
MIDSNEKSSKSRHSNSLWFISLFTLASCFPIVLFKILPATSPSSQTPTNNAGNTLPTLNVANAPENNPQPLNLPKSVPVVPKAPESTSKATQPAIISTPTKTATKTTAKTNTQTKPDTKTATKTTPKTTTTKAKTTNKTKSTPKQDRTKTATAPIIEVSVAIETDVTSLTVGSSTKAVITDEKGRILHNIDANKGLVARVNGNGIQIDNWQLPAVTWIQPQQAGGAVYIGDKWFRGKLLLVANEGKLLAINHVDLEHYLYSVVGSEMHPTANINALKAQAVAARSYALVHIIRPASRWYNLGDTQRWQVYKGIGTEYNTTQQAVNETNNKILSRQGGVVESLYASTEEIVNRAHGGSGMSQTGAYKLAEAGYNYQQILGYYYPGVEVATLVRK